MSILLVGTDLSARGYESRSLALLRMAASEAGLRIEDCELASPSTAPAVIARKRPAVTVALGDEAARACIPGFALSAQEARGYVFGGATRPVMVSVDPALAEKVWVPWRILLATDLKRAREVARNGLRRPSRKVHVAGSVAEARAFAHLLCEAKRIAYDIEIYDSETLSCVGFATSSHEAYVFPARYLEQARIVLECDVPKIAQNGQFDLHFLATRCNVHVRAQIDDTLVAWHACYPELAGASLDIAGKRKGAKRTHKSLAFFASIFTFDAWWKDYEFANDHEMYVLNGRDCCITFECMEHLDRLITDQGVEAIYRSRIAVLEPFVRAQARGLYVDDALRRSRIEAIEARIAEQDSLLDALALPLVVERFENVPESARHLFAKSKQCTCCGGGKVARLECWRCAGFSKKPGKRALAESGITLTTCAECKGEGCVRWFEFNGRSTDQKRILLYDVLKLPKRYNKGALSTDEDALRALLAQVSS